MPKKLILTASSLVLVLTASGCSALTGQDSSLDDVTYHMNDATASPSIDVKTPFAANETQTHVIEAGDGEKIEAGDEVILDVTTFSGEDGESKSTTYGQQPLLIPVNDEVKKNIPEVYDLLINNKVGTSFSFTTNEAQTEPSAEPSVMEKGSPTNIEVYTIKEKLLKTAQGSEVAQDKLPKSLESFTLSEDGQAEIKLAQDRGDAPTDLIAEDMIKGEGATVKETDTLYVRYQGVQWSDGKAFDGNYGNDKVAAAISLDQVIEGWKKGLTGKTVGSRVLLIIPADQAYGDQEGSSDQTPTGALVFVVDILASTETPAAASSSQAQESSAPAESSQAADPSVSASATASASQKAE